MVEGWVFQQPATWSHVMDTCWGPRPRGHIHPGVSLTKAKYWIKEETKACGRGAERERWLDSHSGAESEQETRLKQWPGSQGTFLAMSFEAW